MNTTTASDRSDNGSIYDQQRQRLASKIAVIESQVNSLPGFLPDSYQYLMQQLDQHQHQLLRIILQDEFDAIDSTESIASEY